MTDAWRNKALQARSRATERRIVAATLELLESTGYDDLAVARIAAKAKVSVGGLYARFADKQALMHAIDEHLLAVMEDTVRRAMAPERLAGKDLAAVVRAYVGAMVRFFAAHRGVVREVVLRARARPDEAFTARLRAFNDLAHGLLCERLAAAGGIRHARPDAAAAFGALFVSAAAREVVLFGGRRLNLARPSLAELERELCRAYVAYLTAP